ncbi:melatonin receptor type 1A-like [Actinia tenebrosa]|uniref:Melatonin receptor type 1A-like n=1 Tax=Actinia tenebrosa TaxID=6105 RepID=A0A6P8JAL8_ACTTE|nr:melatonin receptor type 1A-like [Actinia tenebrosa]XP_031574773.1 melatonin receptor type 1A-like [Actinia tenebrosa]XP_031574774.1 melatonin receptor type 1A-like [Actinia tenebrosa]XP_031574775.1 melatonin receptor type 1A-like [Actinia tenebrosa]
MSYQVHPRSTTWVVLESIALVTLNIIIFFGNFIICLVIYKSKRLRTMTNMLVVTLSISDLITASITLPMAAATSILRRWIYGSIGCQVFGFCSKYLVHVSLYIITLIALNRYVRIIKPSLYKKVFTLRRSVALLAFIWVMPALVRIIPILTSSARFVFVSHTATCILAFYEKKSQFPYTVFATLVFIALPMLVIIVCYAAVTRHVRKHRQRISSVRGDQGDLGVSIEEVKVTRTLFALVFTFILCWLPVSVALIFVKSATGSIPTLAARVLSCLVALSSASTPFVYGVLNRPFRKEFKKILPLCCRGNRTFDSESAWNLGLNARDSARNRQGPGNQSSNSAENKCSP